MEKKETSPSILMIEDSEEDYQTVLWALKKLAMPYQLLRVPDGDEALEWLSHTGRYSSSPVSPLPNLILLDLNLPGTDGREILYQLKHTDELKTIPVVILTTTSNPKDVETCYFNRANSYIIKPVSLDKFLKTFQVLLEYWFEACLLNTNYA